MECNKIDAADISVMFPDVPKNIIVKDLEMTSSGEVTINRILDGQIYQNKMTDINFFDGDNDQSNDELPELAERENHFQETDEVINIDVEVNPKHSERACGMTDTMADHNTSLPHSSVQKGKLPKIRSDFLSDNSGSESDDIPELQCPRSGSGISRSHVITTTETFASSKALSESDYKMVADGPPVAISKVIKGRKRTQAEIEESRNTAVLLKEEVKRRKEEEKLRKQQEREQKKREQEFEKQKKKTLMEARKHAKPGECLKVRKLGECLKFMTVVLSPGILKESSGAAILDTLQKSEIKYDIQPQIHDNILTLWREVSEVKEVEPMKLQSVTTEKIEDCVLLVLPVAKFVSLVHNYKQKQLGLSTEEDLHEHITLIKGSLEGRDVTVIVQGLDKYFRLQKTKENRAFKKQIQGSDGGTTKKSKKVSENPTVTRLDVEEALVHLQLFDGCNIRFLEDDQELAKTVKQYVKSVAETPFKRDRLQTGFTFHLDSSRSAAVDRDGAGLVNVWRLQLQQFPLVTAEVANTIMAAHASPLALMKAYKNCESAKQAERLLENLEVRRGAGVMATSRRVGKELSRRVYQFYTSADPDFVIP